MKYKPIIYTGLALGMGLYATHEINGEIAHQGDRLEAKMVQQLSDEGDGIRESLDGSVGTATEEIKLYIGGISLQDFIALGEDGP